MIPSDSTRLLVDPEHRGHQRLQGAQGPVRGKDMSIATVIEYDTCQKRVQNTGFSGSCRKH